MFNIFKVFLSNQSSPFPLWHFQCLHHQTKIPLEFSWIYVKHRDDARFQNTPGNWFEIILNWGVSKEQAGNFESVIFRFHENSSIKMRSWEQIYETKSRYLIFEHLLYFNVSNIEKVYCDFQHTDVKFTHTCWGDMRELIKVLESSPIRCSQLWWMKRAPV